MIVLSTSGCGNWITCRFLSKIIDQTAHKLESIGRIRALVAMLVSSLADCPVYFTATKCCFIRILLCGVWNLDLGSFHSSLGPEHPQTDMWKRIVQYHPQVMLLVLHWCYGYLLVGRWIFVVYFSRAFSCFQRALLLSGRNWSKPIFRFDSLYSCLYRSILVSYRYGQSTAAVWL